MVKNRTVVIIDADNLTKTLLKKDLRLGNLKTFVRNILEPNDVLVRFENREELLFNPVVYVVSRMIKKDVRTKQIQFLNRLKKDNRNIIETSVVDPKIPYRGQWCSCTDSEIGSFIAIALYDKNVDKIIVVSGDGDFLMPLSRIGLAKKKVDMVSVEESFSEKLANFVETNEGRVIIIKERIPGLVCIKEKEPRRVKKLEPYLNRPDINRGINISRRKGCF